MLESTKNWLKIIVLEILAGLNLFFWITHISNLTFGWVDLRDVANEHILALEIPSASGRHCLAERVAHFSKIVKSLHDLYPDVQSAENTILNSCKLIAPDVE
ncbi:hypothetical protein BVC80_8311g7 [Macleaya cordata]|uniref:Uncharacterized protein n=1 Tax=Macleaya cordata TaxID=56857 RepID=A0A200QXH8_MACCD|nr:hypothetical protein BVC80_8311g7 [Macleaya cordata]